MELTDRIKELSFSYIKDTKIYNELQRAFAELENGQEALYALSSKTEDGSLTLLKVGTLLSFSIVERMWTSDKHPKEFSQEDWTDIARKVTDFGILADGQLYTEFIFTLYSNYIKLSVDLREDILTDDRKAEILDLSDQLIELNGLLEEGAIKEPDYVDKCLWISFEAMMKLLSAYRTRFMDTEFREFFQAVSDLAVQYARLSIYSKEQALLQEYIEHQYVLDSTLEEKYNNYIANLEERTEQFSILVDKAFDPGFRDMLISSVDLAKAAGVDESQILDSMDKIDDYFS